ncbi:hypothetical protein JQC92_02425 [Shewanella sp. 202IG2-18]|uniref:hypothetical protein n=1 Tax=Parashewanella hymeniacidonis TaxID=2807618 RepID=UPI001960554A|nr:hypothetical protein [Parashewanella hymeniacidonis]MBM7070897.1 hypothetical protein [Parashewanella hymeniacidonis]
MQCKNSSSAPVCREWCCDSCASEIFVPVDYEPSYCCSGAENQCGCMGKPINPAFCNVCKDKFCGVQVMPRQKKTAKQCLVEILTGNRFLALHEIRAECISRFDSHHSEAALSARWREIHSPFKEKRRRKNSQAFEYRIKEAA